MRTNHIALTEMILLLQSEPASATEIKEHTGWTNKPVYGYLRIWYAKGLIRIAEYRKTNRNFIPLYEWVDGRKLPDAKYPEVKTSAEKSQQYRDRKKQKELVNIISKKKERTTIS